MAGPGGFEPPISCLKGTGLNHLRLRSHGCRGRSRTSTFPLNRREPYQLDHSAMAGVSGFEPLASRVRAWRSTI